MRVHLLFLAALVSSGQNPDPAARNPLAGEPAAIAAGERIFTQACATCHSDPNRAPSLLEGVWAHGEEDAEIFQNIRAGIDGTEMPPFLGLSTDEIWQVVAFLRGPSMPIADRGKAPLASGAGGGDAAAGEVVFNAKGNCVSCHLVNGRGGIVGPDLSEAGRRPAAALRRKIVTPDNPLDPVGAGRSGRH